MRLIISFAAGAAITAVMVSQATGQDRRPMECVPYENGVVRNICEERLAYFYCYDSDATHLPTCGKPSVGALAGKPEHYFTHLNILDPGKTFTVPFHRVPISFAVCGEDESGQLRHAVYEGNGEFVCERRPQSLADEKVRQTNALSQRFRRVMVELEHRKIQNEREKAEREENRRNSGMSTFLGILNAIQPTTRQAPSSPSRPSSRRTPGFCMDLRGRPIPGGCD